MSESWQRVELYLVLKCNLGPLITAWQSCQRQVSQCPEKDPSRTLLNVERSCEPYVTLSASAFFAGHFEVSRSPVDSSTAWAELGTVLGTELVTVLGGPGLRHNYTGQWSPRHQW